MHTPRQTRGLLATALLFTTMMLSQHVTAQTARSTPATVVAAAAQAPDLSTFNKLVQQVGLTSALEATGPVTVFAPTDEAFKALPAATLDKLSRNPEFLKTVLSYHVVPGALKATNIGATSTLTTLNGAQITAAKAGDFITVDEGLVTKADLIAGNGVVHTIDRVLLPAAKK